MSASKPFKLDYETAGSPNPEQLVIWLHGLGADGHDFMPVAQALNLPNTKFIFPHAPMRPITLNQGMVMRGWYDIASLERFQEEDEQGMLETRDAVNALILEQVSAGFKHEQITLAGFSQGGCMALLTGLSCTEKLKSIIALSCYLPLRNKLEDYASEQNKNTPIFMAHGTLDPIVDFSFGEQSAIFLQQKGYAIDLHSYAMAHQVCPDEIEAIHAFLV